MQVIFFVFLRKTKKINSINMGHRKIMLTHH